MPQKVGLGIDKIYGEDAYYSTYRHLDRLTADSQPWRKRDPSFKFKEQPPTLG